MQTMRGTIRIANLHAITLHIKLAGHPRAVNVVPAELKYNKEMCLQFDLDDGGKVLYTDVLPFFNSLTYTDGAGKPKAYKASAAVFAINPNTRAELGSGKDPSKFTAAQLAEMITTYGWDASNHSEFHNDVDAVSQVAANQALVKMRLAPFGVSLAARTMRTGVVPTNFADYVPAFYRQGEIIEVTSQGTTDAGYVLIPAVTINPWLVSSLPAPMTYVQRRGFVGDTLTASAISTYQGYFDQLLASTPSARKMFRFFSHGASPTDSFQQLFHYIYDKAADRLWMPTQREFAEYYETKRLTTISQVLTGNLLTVTLDQMALPTFSRWRDMSLLLSGATIQSVTMSGGNNLTYNSATGLINVYKQA
jgi:hypothetical protein